MGEHAGKSEREAKRDAVLSLLAQVRNRLTTVAWALHGMHSEQDAPSADDIAGVEQLVTETLEGPFSEAAELVSELIGPGEESLTRH